MTAPRPHAAPWTVSEVDEDQVAALAHAAGLSDVVSRLLVARGVTAADDADRFLHPSLERDWREPLDLPDMLDAVERIVTAIQAGQRIVVFGDFDADGVSASAIMHRALALLGADVETVVPHRFREGYGLTDEALPRVLRLEPSLVVTVDCGVSSAVQVDRLREAGVDVIVTDHHELGDGLPQGVPLVNPKCDEAYPFHGLAGAGVALKLAQAVGARMDRPDLWLSLTQIACLGTIGDVVPLRDENRALVAHGLESARTDAVPGIAALADAAGIDVSKLSAENVAFALAPRLNAAGRMADPELAFELLTTDDPGRADELARELHELNRLRQSTERDLFERALLDARVQVEGGAPAVVIAGEGWHEGVRGIVASRLVRRLEVPALVFTLEEGIASGSGRSVPGLDLFGAVSESEALLERFGGHPMAVGVTLAEARLDEFREALCAHVAAASVEPRGVVVDGEIALEEVGIELAAEIALLEPFGEGNRRPLFGARGVFMHDRRRVGRNSDHLIFDAFDGVTSVPAVAFRCPEIEAAALHDAAADVVFELEEDEWRGRRRTRLLVRELVRHEPGVEGPAASLIEDLFDSAPAILARQDYAGIEDAESFHTKLAGVTFEGRQEVLTSLAAETPLRLERQPDNEYDANACALFAPDGRQAGFFNRRLAAALAPLLDRGLELDVRVTEVTGGEEGRSLGVNVLVTRRDLQTTDEAEDRAEARGMLEGLSASDLDAALVENLIPGRSVREAQASALEHLGRGEDCLCVMATGRGKSLIFHLHAARKAVAEGQASVLVYPLRALVSDQAFALGETLGVLGVSCETVTGETSPTGRDEAFEQLADGTLDVVLTTPEFLDHHAERFAASGRIGFLVVDEAHHVGLARAGHRPAYARMGEVRQRLGSPQTLAVTATAGDDVAEAITGVLGIDNVVVDPSVRENLGIGDRRDGRDKLAYIASVASRGEKTIVYVNSRDTSIRIASKLREKAPALRHRCAFYNGGLSRAARHAVERAFRDGEITAIIATSAFGEGVDIPDIRHVVHYHLPFNEIEFNQMSGRAGRDGDPASIHLLFGPRDARLNELILESVAPERDDMAQLYLVLRDVQAASADEDGAFEITNAELADEVSRRRPRSKMTDKGVSAALGVFRELGLVNGEGAGSYRRLALQPMPETKLDLAESVRYAEGTRELETFEEFKRWVLASPAEELLVRFNRPILPTRYA